MLGPLEVRRRGELMALGGPKQQAVLATLLADANRVVSADRLIDDLWGAHPPPTAGKAVQVYVSQLRKALEPDRTAGADSGVLVTQGAGYRLTVEPGQLDAARFADLIAAGRRALSDGFADEAAELLRQALGLWRGTPFDGLWLDALRAERTRLSELHVGALEDALAADLELGRDAEVAAAAEHLVITYPLRERIWAHLVLALYRTGRQAEALSTYRKLRSTLRQELGIDPSADLQRLHHAVLIQDPALAAQRRVLVPSQPNPLLGRDLEVDEVIWLLREAGNRLVTITGAPGVGKTRLAIEVGTRAGGGYPDGAVFVDLAPVSDARIVPYVIAGTLKIHDVTRQSGWERLTLRLGQRELLLILDNVEQVADSAPDIAELVAACPKLRVLATSREPLHVSWEHEYPLAPLPVPDRDVADAETALEHASTQLFIQRARATDPALAAEPSWRAVAALCRRLDGLPLAIELAAARTKVLSPEAILVRLEQGYGLLTSQTREMVERHRTLDRAIGWSYDLLTPDEQTLLCRLGVFAGGCTLDAVAAVLAPDDATALDQVTSLVDKNLLVRTPGEADEPRFSMLETIRQYAVERLTAAAGLADVHRSHARFFLTLAEQAKAAIDGPDRGEWLARMDREAANVAAALDWAEQNEPELALRLTAALGTYWYRRGYVVEGRSRIRRALTAAAPAAAANARLRADGLNAAGMLAQVQGDYLEAVECLAECAALRRRGGDLAGLAATLRTLGFVAYNQGELAEGHRLVIESLELAQQLANPRLEGNALIQLGNLYQREGDFDQATSCFTEAQEIWERLGDKLRAADALTGLGNVANDTGDQVASVEYHQASVAMRREIDDRLNLGLALNNLGNTLSFLGRTTEAEAAYVEALTAARAQGNRRSAGFALNGLGILALRAKDHAAARAAFDEALRIRHTLGEKLEVFKTLEQLANLALAQDQPARALTLGAAAMTLRESIGATLRPVDAPLFDHELPAARAELDHATAEEVWRVGQRMSMDDAVSYALSKA